MSELDKFMVWCYGCDDVGNFFYDSLVGFIDMYREEDD